MAIRATAPRIPTRHRIWILAKVDPHPNPPHKGEGTLPRNFNFHLAPKGNLPRSAPTEVSLPLWGGLGVGVHRRAKASAFHRQ
ncbi:hypothetical protein MES4922_40142 [Mesorhizobium ventifaucium]|uniref:Uncharacterized protein n=1 Tax=Mesorhizobium ventifaucium TaxID=666020 RepID=A0ABN8K825_9HYPH|nr:hypothetical protein MES4922_40142 [Mesorhizobium ventifaucium]